MRLTSDERNTAGQSKRQSRSYLLLADHGQDDVGDLARKPLPLVLILFMTLLQHQDEHLQHLPTKHKLNTITYMYTV